MKIVANSSDSRTLAVHQSLIQLTFGCGINLNNAFIIELAQYSGVR